MYARVPTDIDAKRARLAVVMLVEDIDWSKE
jgi:hypothetical protein